MFKKKAFSENKQKVKNEWLKEVFASILSDKKLCSKVS